MECAQLGPSADALAAAWLARENSPRIHALPALRPPAHPDVLVWLERNVRAPVDGWWIDRAVFAPAKRLYLRQRRQD